MKPDYAIIGKRIKEARLEKHLKQEDLADKLNISIAYISRVEKGNAHINLKRLTQVAEELDLSPAYLITGSNTTSKDYLKEDFRRILEKCTPMQQKLIYQIAELVSNINVN